MVVLWQLCLGAGAAYFQWEMASYRQLLGVAKIPASSLVRTSWFSRDFLGFSRTTHDGRPHREASGVLTCKLCDGWIEMDFPEDPPAMGPAAAKTSAAVLAKALGAQALDKMTSTLYVVSFLAS